MLDYRFLFRKIRKIVIPKSIILLYHRVANIESDPQLLAVSKTNFEVQMQYLKQNYKILSLSELVNFLRNNRVPRHRVVITFDDGYADNLYNAKPILEKFEIPADVFIVAGMIDKNREYWWDDLERIFLLGKKLPETLELEINKKNYLWNSRNSGEYKKVYQELQYLLRFLSANDLEEKIKEILKWANLPLEGRETYRCLTSEEIRKLVRSNLIDIGAHSMGHLVLSSQSLEQQKWEIENSKQILENILGRKIFSFSYPFGTSTDFTSETENLVQEAGFKSGVADIQTNVRSPFNLYALPRRIIRNWNLSKFKENIEKYFNGKSVNIIS
ncbi:polysaccharide deacetylase family protein [candidate division WOR-3 bacterium]|nr:polysaccharide deacetylase family protein [candidate division WOR-3 bacterium]